MSLTVALERISDIQTQIQQLSTTSAVSTASTSTSSTTATDFASAISDVLGSASSGAVTGTDIVEQAKSYLGVPYVFGGEDRSGIDCSGLVQRVLADLGIDAPRVVQDQADIGVEVPSLDQAQPGDLLVVKGEGHIVIYAGDGKIIHAPRPGKSVELVDNYLSPSEISTIRRVVPDAGAATVSGAGLTDTTTSLLSMYGASGFGGVAGAIGGTSNPAESQLLAMLRSGFLNQAVRP
ncbi:C40 family peptidase [Paramicrobacterium agarici]|uniref:C40 family peptidase n=1 Tax=Paramicrobacterium agarici TaxID=630514 RepID=UPI00115452AE|nr:C40 family peptidase [Microbacterium agarici]TQO23622.1 cell wall-associated NlpC family hydrolase [Microbacterium agarici]